MGRKRSVNQDLALFPRLRRRKLKNAERYYYEHDSGKREPLGGDFWHALDRYKLIEANPEAPVTLATELAAFKREYLPTLERGTQYMYERAILRLSKVFGKRGYDLTKAELMKYITLSKAKVRAKRDIGCLSSMWSWAERVGRTKVPNPRIGLTIHRTREEKRKVQPGVDPAIFDKFKDVIVRETLDLLYLSGQDIGVVLSWRREHVKWDEGVLDTTRAKTVLPMRIKLYDDDGHLTDFALALKRTLDRPRKVGSLFIIANHRGQPLTYQAFWQRFKRDRQAAGVTFELRAIRRQTASDATTLQAAQELLGHADTATTRKHYRRGEKVKPLR